MVGDAGVETAKLKYSDEEVRKTMDFDSISREMRDGG